MFPAAVVVAQVVPQNQINMSSKEIEVVCSCCSARLTVDVLTQTVLRAVSPRETDEFGKPRLDENRWDAAAGRVQDRGEDAGSRLDAALEREKSRANQLDDLFDKAKRKLDEKQGDED